MFGKTVKEENTASVIPASMPEEPVYTAPAPVVTVETIIGEGARLVGTLTVKSLLRIDGVVEGEVISDNKVVISEKGLIKGNVTASHICLGGEINGNIHSLEKTEILSTGRMYGDIQTKTMVMDENAVFEGKCTMAQSPSRDSGVQETDYLPDLSDEDMINL